MTSNSVSVEADLYVLVRLESEQFWQSLKRNPESRSLPIRARDDFVVRKAQQVPSGMSDWRYENISITPEIVAQRAIPRTMPATSLELIPDTLDWSPLRIVRTRFKDFLEAEFPDGSYFYPFSYRDAETKEVKHPDIWFWLPRHFLRFKPQEKRGRNQHMRSQVWGALSGLSTTWEMYHNKVFQSFVADLPFWTPSGSFKEVVFRSDVYHRLKAEGFTGFVEAEADNHLRHTPEQSVGYIQYGE